MLNTMRIKRREIGRRRKKWISEIGNIFLSIFGVDVVFQCFRSVFFFVDIFNLFGIRNTISYLWISDVNQNEYAVPNYLTSRILNLRLNLTF